ncbi:MAG: helix-turn-helix transcriptional regulator [Chitinophagaceae bacterium]|nr:helix-turn-helix transcriptional regulator [Chitinophagaceae bacterium]
MEADVHILYESDYYSIIDFRCLCQSCAKTKNEYTEKFSISFVRSGNFYYHTWNKTLDRFNGEILISKPDYEHAVTHVKDAWDHCTLLQFTENFYTSLQEKYSHNCSWFFRRDIQSVLIHCKAEMQYLHDAVLEAFRNKTDFKLKIDDLIFELVESIFTVFSAGEYISSGSDLKKVHLTTIERAKDYISRNFHSDISLKEIASSCYVSPFHFSRIFKSFTRYSPHQFLLLYRLKHAELLLRTTQLPVTDICYLSGFNYVEHFDAAFKKKYSTSPSSYQSFRQKKNSNIS